MCAAQIRGTDSLQLGGVAVVGRCVRARRVHVRLTSLDILTRLMRDQWRTIESFHADLAAAPRWDEARPVPRRLAPTELEATKLGNS